MINEKIARWLGFTHIDSIWMVSKNKGYTNYYEKGGIKYPPHDLDLVGSMDACIKWITPELEYICVESVAGGFFANIKHKDKDNYYQGVGRSMSHAVCDAINNFLDGRLPGD